MFTWVLVNLIFSLRQLKNVRTYSDEKVGVKDEGCRFLIFIFALL